jgi:DNA-binding CsgD family transcriptional regulator
MGIEIVGRDAELATGAAFLEGVRVGAGALVVAGAAGIGKTVLWRALVEQAVDRGYTVLACQAERAEAGLSLVGLADLVGGVTDEVLATLPEPQRDALEVALLRRPPGNGVVEPRTLAAGLRSILVGLASRAPLIVGIDDVQWLDQPSMAAVAFAARRLAGLRVGLLVTERTPAPAPDPLGLERALGAQRQVVELGGLSVAALRLLLESQLGWAYSRSVLVRVAETSGSNPLFALEIARCLGPAPTIGPGDPLPVPNSLREVIAGRVQALSPPARRALLAAAALARPDVGLVARSSSAAGLTAAEETGILRIEGDRVVFAHPLYRFAVYGAASTHRRRALHRRLAAAVADPDERARHLALGASAPDEPVAAALEDAAARARSRGAPEVAAELLHLAFSLTPGSRPDARARRKLLAAEDYLYAGDRTPARQLLEDVTTEVRPGPARAGALRLLAQMHFDGSDYPAARSLLEQGLAEAAGDPRLTARMQLDLAWLVSQTGAPQQALPLVQAVIEWAEPRGDRPLLASAVGADVFLNVRLGHPVDEQKLERALAMEDWTTRQFRGLRPSFNAASSFLLTGNLPQARICIARLRHQLTTRGEEEELPVLAWQAVLVACASGELIEAARIAQEAVAAASAGDSLSLGIPLMARALSSAYLGRVDEARADAAEASAIFGAAMGYHPDQRHPPVSVGVAAVLAFAALSTGDASTAHEILGPLADVVLADGLGEPYSPADLPDEIEALVALGELEKASRLIGLLDERGRALDRPWALAVAARGRGLLLAARGDLEGAERAIEEALSQHQRMDMPFDLGRTLLAEGQIRRRARHKRAAKESLQQAYRLFHDMGARLWAEQAQTELNRLGLRRTPNELTVTERRVAQLAATGSTAKQIAAALFVSPRTVESNLVRVYQKLGVSSRAGLGARMTADNGPLEPELPKTVNLRIDQKPSAADR